MPPKAERKPRQSKKQTINAVVSVPVIEIITPVSVPEIINNEVENNPVYSDDEDEPENKIIETKEEVIEEEEDDDDGLTEEEKEKLREAEEIKNKMRLRQEQKEYQKFKKLQGLGVMKEEVRRQLDMISQFVKENNIYDIVINLFNENDVMYCIESITEEDEDGMVLNNGADRYLKPLYEKMKQPIEQPQPIKAVKKEKVVKKEGVRVSTDMKRPKNLASCFKRDTLIHHNKGGNNEYAMVSSANGKVHRCNSEMKEAGENYESINAFTNENYKRKNEREGTNRTLRNNAYVECLYKNDAGIWCSCDDLRDGKILTEK